MGGLSYGTFEIIDGVGVEEGEVVDVPSLQAPGFITVASVTDSYPDARGCDSISFSARSAYAYGGFRISVGTSRPACQYSCLQFSVDRLVRPLPQADRSAVPFQTEGATRKDTKRRSSSR